MAAKSLRPYVPGTASVLVASICKPNLSAPIPGISRRGWNSYILAGNKGCARMDGDLFFGKAGLNRKNVQAIIDRALVGSDDGELFLEFCRSESFSFDDGRLKAASFDTTQGFGLRAVAGEATGYAHANELSEDAIRRAAETVSAVSKGHAGSLDLSPVRTNAKLYGDEDPLASAEFAAKIKLLEEMNAYARAKDSRVRQVSCALAGEHQTIEILRAGGESWRDI